MSSRAPRNLSLENRTVGKYELVREIGRGAMATVYAARDTFTEREVAVKVANPEINRDDKRARISRKLFFNEAKAAGMLEHPNIVAVYDAGVQEDIRYIVMEYVAGGETLHDYCHPERLLPVEAAVDVMLKCAVAFDYAHRKGVIHRDIKPKNILLTEDRDIKIGDFGIALVTEMDAADTQVTGYLGSPLYMAPEQLRGETVSNQADLFALGVVMYELLSGRHPFAAPTIEAITHNVTREAHIPVHEHRSEIPRILSRVIDRLLKKHPAGRYGMGLDLAGDLSLIFDHISVSQSQVTGQQRFARVRELIFFRGLGDAEVWEVLNAGVWETHSRKTEIIGPNDDLDSFYVLVEGEVSVVLEGLVTDRMSAGSCFGDLGGTERAERGASVVADSDVTVMQVRRNIAERASESCRIGLNRAFLGATTRRLARVTAALGEQLRTRKAS